MSLEKLTLEELNTETQATIVDIVKVSGRDTAFVSKAIRMAELTPVASVQTNKPGRPPRVFNRAELLAAVEAAVTAETEKANALALKSQTETATQST